MIQDDEEFWEPPPSRPPLSYICDQCSKVCTTPTKAALHAINTRYEHAAFTDTDGVPYLAILTPGTTEAPLRG